MSGGDIGIKQCLCDLTHLDRVRAIWPWENYKPLKAKGAFPLKWPEYSIPQELHGLSEIRDMKC